MKVLCVSPGYWPAFKYGGPIFSVHGLNKALMKKGIDVSVYTISEGLNTGLPLNQEIDIDGIKVTYFGFLKMFEWMGSSGWQFSSKIIEALRTKLPLFDLIHIHAVWNYPVAITAHYCRKYRKPYIISPRGVIYPYAIHKMLWKKWAYLFFIAKRDLMFASAIHYTTDDEAKRCHSPLGLKNKAIVIPNGIDGNEFAHLPEKEKIKIRYPILKDKKIILFLGRIHEKKGLDILLKACSILAKERHDIHILVVGDGESEYKKKIEKLVRDYRISEMVTFTGMCLGTEKLEAYAGSDIFVLPSYSENFGMSVAEAMACGMPVIISNEVGIHKEVYAAEAGAVVPCDADLFAQAMKKLLDDPALCIKLGENGRQLVNRKFILDNISGEMVLAYEKIVAEHNTNYRIKSNSLGCS